MIETPTARRAPHATAAAGATEGALVSMDVHVAAGEASGQLRSDARSGLVGTPKTMPPRWFYDDAGSALFTAITELDEYYPTRREAEILAAHADDIAAVATRPTLVELGSGTSAKTRILLDAMAPRGLQRFVPFDISVATLERAAVDVAASYPGLEVHAIAGDFDRHLDRLPTASGGQVIAFLGGTIGNLRPAARARFLRTLAAVMSPGDALLLGTDLVKAPSRLIAAYDDAAGVTAAFNLNLLHVLNRELGADFDVEAFLHVARWDPEHEWMEMRLRASRPMRVSLPGADIDIRFAAGEDLLTEVSAKFRRDGLCAELASAGFELTDWWTDRIGDFAVSLSSRR